MKQGPLVELISDALGIEKAKVRYITRCLREDRFLTTGARGVNAPEMTWLDAARITLTLMIDTPPKRASKEYPRYHELSILNGPREGDGSLSEALLLDAPCDSLEVFLAELFGFFADPERIGKFQGESRGEKYDPQIILSVSSDASSTIIEDRTITVSEYYDHLRIEFDDMDERDGFFERLFEVEAKGSEEELKAFHREEVKKFDAVMQKHRAGHYTMKSTREINQEAIGKIARGMAADGMPPPYFYENLDGV